MAEDKKTTNPHTFGKATVPRKADVEHLAHTRGISIEEAKKLIERFGDDELMIEKEANKKA